MVGESMETSSYIFIKFSASCFIIGFTHEILLCERTAIRSDLAETSYTPSIHWKLLFSSKMIQIYICYKCHSVYCISYHHFILIVLMICIILRYVIMVCQDLLQLCLHLWCDPHTPVAYHCASIVPLSLVMSHAHLNWLDGPVQVLLVLE